MARLTQKDILNNTLKQAFDREVQRQAKYAHFKKHTKDKRLRKMFELFEMTSQSHIAELKQEMYKLDIK